MDGAIFVLTREVPGDQGQQFTQTVAVFADNPTEARGIVAREFALLRQGSTANERPYGPTPSWKIDKVSLNEHKLVAATITT